MIFSFIFQLAFVAVTMSHPNCVYKVPTPIEMQARGVVEPIYNEPLAFGRHERLRRSTTTHPLNIAAFYETSFNNEANSAELKSKIVDKAIQFWESVLRIKTTTGRIRLSRHCNSVNVTYYGIDSNPAHYYCTDGCSSRTVCGHTVIPDSHLDYCREMQGQNAVTSGSQGTGIDADFILYISAVSSESCNNNNGILGYAAHCQQEHTMDRPIAGYINFCPGKLSTALGYLQQSLFTAQHEILHALGFAVSLYAYFRDSNGQPLTPRRASSNVPALGYRPNTYIYQWSNNVTVNRTLSWKNRYGMQSKQVTLLVLPNVVREARAHFNCPSLEGVELEDQGDIGVALTHWEKRLLENELMTGTYTHEHVVSRMTLAFMQDTGWYAVDYSKAESFAWGRNLGCNFVTQSCLAWMDDHPSDPSPFCRRLDKSGNGITTTSCTYSRRSVGYCVLDEYSSSLPTLYQYFNSLPGVSNSQLSRYGGGVYLADYCPFVQGFNWRSGSTVTRTTDCRNTANNAALTSKVNLGVQYHDTLSICVITDNKWSIYWCDVTSKLKTFGSGCFMYECSYIYGLVLKVNNRSYQCLSGGLVLNISSTTEYYLHQGGLVCPNCADVCGTQCPSSPARIIEPIRETTIPCSANKNCKQCEKLIVYLFFSFILIVL